MRHVTEQDEPSVMVTFWQELDLSALEQGMVVIVKVLKCDFLPDPFRPEE